MQFYALTDEPESSESLPLRRIRVDESAKSLMEEVVLAQASDLLDPEAKRIPFDAGFQARRGEHTFVVENFPTPSHIDSVLAKPDLPLDLTQQQLEDGAVKAIISIDFGNPEPPVVYFQAFDRRYSLATGDWFLWDDKMFRPLGRPGITLSKNVDAVLSDGNLYFVSPTMVRRVLDFSVVFEPATDERLEEFASHGIFHYRDGLDMKSLADTRVRKRVSQLLARGILDLTHVPDIVSLASDFSIDVETVEEDGEFHLVIPEEKSQLKDLLTLLEEKLYHSPLTDELMEASGNRYWNR